MIYENTSFCTRRKHSEKTQELVHHRVSNIGKILPIITSVCHLVCVQNHCYCMQISCYHINTLLSRQFPHLRGQTGVSNRQSNFIFFFFFKMQIGSSHLLEFVTFFRYLFLSFYSLCISSLYSHCSLFIFFL